MYKIEFGDPFQNDGVSEYYCFNEFFEEALYREYEKPTKTIRNPGFPFDAVYFQYGSLLIDLGRYEDAETALINALRWNPASVSIALERSEACKLQGKLEDFYKNTARSFRYAFRRNQLAHCYRNVGYYFSEKEMWSDAVSCYFLSLGLDKDSEVAVSELYYIQEKSGKRLEDLSGGTEYSRKMCEKNGFPFRLDQKVIDLAAFYIKKFTDEGDKEGAEYCKQILRDLTGKDDF